MDGKESSLALLTVRNIDALAVEINHDQQQQQSA